MSRFRPLHLQILRGVWELIHNFASEFVANTGTGAAAETPTLGFDIALLAGAWLKDNRLDQAVFDFAATFPIPRLEGFDPDDFVQRLALAG
jgi:hypothetical protein